MTTEPVSYIFFNNPFNPFVFTGIIAVLMLLTWYFTKGLRHRLVKKNYAIIFALHALCYILILFSLAEPMMKKITISGTKGRLIVLFDGSLSTTLRNDSPWKLMYQPDNPIVKNLKNYTPEYYIFSDVVKKLDASDINIPEMPEDTDIVSCLETILKNSSASDEMKILLFSDGRSGVNAEQLDRLKLRGVPVYTVGLGRDRTQSSGVKDIIIGNADIPDIIPVFKEIRFRADIKALGYPDESVSVAFSANGQNISKNTVALTKGRTDFETEFAWEPSLPGRYELLIKAAPKQGEKDEKNNFLIKNVQVISESRKVLLVQGGAGWETAYLKKCLFSFSETETDTILFAGSNTIITDNPGLKTGFPGEKELMDYGLIIFSDCPFELYNENIADSIEKFISVMGRGVIFAGFKNPGTKGSVPPPAVKLFPVVLTEHTGKTAPSENLSITGEGRNLLFSGMEKAALKEPFLASGIADIYAKPSASVLMDDENRNPLCVFQRYGTGRIIYTGFKTSWLWCLTAEDSQEKKFYFSFWKAAVNLGLGDIEASKTGDKIMIRSESAVNIAGVQARLKITLAPEIPTESVKTLNISVTDSSEREFTLPWKFPFGGASYIYASFTPREPGEYRIKAGITADNKNLSDTLVLNIRKDTREYENISLNEGILRKISSATGGSYMEFDEFVKKPHEFICENKQLRQVSFRPLWCSEIFFWVMTGILGLLWILKRSINME